MKKLYIFLFVCTQLQTTTIRVSDLSQKNIVALCDYHHKNPGPLMIKVDGESSAFQTLMEYGKRAVGKADSVAGTIDRWDMVKPIAQWAAGGTIASYGTGLYFIYRAYELVQTVGSWTHYAEQANEEELVLYIRSTQKKTMQQQYFREIEKEKDILEKYLKVHKYLCRWHMRKLFLYDRASHRSIVKSYTRLCALERELCE